MIYAEDSFSMLNVCIMVLRSRSMHYCNDTTEKLMLILQACQCLQVARSHPYFLKKTLVKNVKPIYKYVW